MDDLDKATIGQTMAFAVKAKRQMLDRNLVRAKKQCPHCSGMVHLALAGQKNHLHAYCDTCTLRVME